jgi:chromate reductase
MSSLDIVGLCGSLRSGSFNRMVLNLAGSLLPPSMAIKTLSWRDIPILDGDVLAKGFPPEVVALRERVRRADGIVIATPEYNFSIPGGLKNVIDWVGRGEDQPLAGKPIVILSASTGPLGGARVQYELRRVLTALNAMTLAKPEVFVGMAATKFDADGQCTDETTRKFVGAQMQAFEQWVRKVQRMNG